MTEKLIPATRVVIEVKPDRQIEGPPTDEIVMSSWLRNGKWSGVITMLKSIFDEHSDVLTIGSCHDVTFWTNRKPFGSGNIEISEILPKTDGLRQQTIELRFEGTEEPHLVM